MNNIIKTPLREIAYEIREMIEPTLNDSFAYVGLEHIEQQSLRLAGIGDSKDTKSTKKVFRKGDILFGSLRPYFRKVVCPNFSGVCSTDITVIRSYEGFDQNFVFYLIATPSFIEYATNISNGTRMPRANWNTLQNSEWKIPPLPTQQKIAAILSAYDDLIENNTRRIKILEEMAQTLYREWFVHFRYPGHEGVPLVESPLGLIPEGWEVGFFTDIINVLSGGTPKTSVDEYWGDEIPWFTPQDLTNSYFVIDTLRKITNLGLSKCASKLFPKYTTFITARGTVGKCVLTHVPMAMSQTNYALTGKFSFPQFFIYIYTLSHVERLKQQATGAVFDTIIVDTFNKLSVFIPPSKLVLKFENLIKPLFYLIENLQLKNKNLRQQRELLVPRLISGELDVENLEIES